MKIGLALSGGGARGFVHVGVLQALTESGIQLHGIAGTSAGAIIGSLYTAGYSASEIMEIAPEQSLMKMINLRLPKRGFASHRFLRKKLEKYLPGNSFEGLKMPFSVVVANLNSGQPEIFTSGPLIDLVVASCSIPILFNPVHIDGKTYVDGGLLMNLPASPLRKDYDIVIGVNLVPRIPVEDKELSSVFAIGSRSFDLAALNNIKPELSQCDLVIEPSEVSKLSRFSMSSIKRMYDIGYAEAMKRMDEIKEITQGAQRTPQSA